MSQFAKLINIAWNTPDPKHSGSGETVNKAALRRRRRKNKQRVNTKKGKPFTTERNA